MKIGRWCVLLAIPSRGLAQDTASTTTEPATCSATVKRSVDGPTLQLELVGSGPCELRFLPTEGPRTQTRLHLDDLKQGRHFEVAWDPILRGPLLRTVVVPKSVFDGDDKATLSVALWSAPHQFGSRGGVPIDLGWHVDGDAAPPKGAIPLIAPSPKDHAPSSHVRIDVLASVSKLPTGEEGVVRLEAGGAGAADAWRAFGFDPTAAATDVLDGAAAVVVRKARAAALEAVRTEVLRLACGAEATDFPATCEALEAVSLDQLGASADKLVAALASDGVDVLVDRLTLASPAKEMVHDALRTVARGATHGGVSQAEAQRLLATALAHARASDSKPTKLVAGAFDLCDRIGGCDEGVLHDIVADPTDWFSEAPLAEEVAAETERVKRAVSLAWRTAHPPSDATLESQLGSVIELLFLVLAIESGDDGEALAPFEQFGTDLASGHVADALLVVGSVITEGADTTARDTRRTELLVGLATFAQDLAAARAETDAEARREATETAFVNLANATTRRDGRGGEWILSLGGSLAMGAGASLDGTPDVGPALPLGVAFDLVRPGPAADESGALGFHLGLYAVDPGRYLALDDDQQLAIVPETAGDPLDWGALVMPQVEVALAVGPRSTPVTLGVWGGYDVPGATAVLGARLGLYAPLLDLPIAAPGK